MTDAGAHARRSTIQLGDIEIEGFCLSDGSYRMSQAGAAKAIGEAPVYALRFLTSKDSKSLLGSTYTDYTPESIEVEPSGESRGQTRINALPLEVVTGYWLYRSFKGNRKAFTLTWALLIESLNRRFDTAFGIQRTEDDYNQLLADQNAALQSTLEALGEAYTEPDNLREQVARLEEQIRQMGGEPWQLPESK